MYLLLLSVLLLLATTTETTARRVIVWHPRTTTKHRDATDPWFTVTDDARLGTPDPSWIVEPDRAIYATEQEIFWGGGQHQNLKTTTKAPTPRPHYALQPRLLTSVGGGARFNGTGVTIYVLDSGCDLTNPLLAGRAVAGPSYVGATEPPSGVDPVGHGTHVTYTSLRVAGGATAVCIKVFNSALAGTVSGAIQAMSWVVDQCTNKKCVANLSGGATSGSKILDAAAEMMLEGGVVLSAAAGNYGGATCMSPARSNASVSVGALTFDGKIASFSDVGACVDVWAVGDGVVSAAPMPLYTQPMSGTSMASPISAGAVARFKQAEPTLSGWSLRNWFLTFYASKGRLGLDDDYLAPAEYQNQDRASPAFPASLQRARCVSFDVTATPAEFVLCGTPIAFDRRTVTPEGKYTAFVDFTTKKCGLAALQEGVWYPIVLRHDPGEEGAKYGFAGGSFASVSTTECTVPTATTTTPPPPLPPPCRSFGQKGGCERAVGRCVWFGGGCVASGFCGFKSMALCLRRGDPCAWSGGSCQNVRK